MIAEFLDEAEQELIEAVLWYESKEKGLGQRFREEVGHVLGRIIEDPLLWRECSGGYRRVNCPVFPYYIPFFVPEDSSHQAPLCGSGCLKRPQMPDAKPLTALPCSSTRAVAQFELCTGKSLP